MQRRAIWAVLLVALSTLCRSETASQQPRYPISGTVVDALNNQPIARALVRLTPISSPGQLTSLTGNDGRFAFANIPKGKYRLSAQRRGQNPQAFHETGLYSTAIAVGAGLDATGIVFPLRPQAALSVLVLDEDGEPMPSANVLLFREDIDEGEKRVLQVSGNVTNSLGRCHAGSLQAGKYFVAVQASSWFPPLANGSGSDIVYPLTYYGDTADAQSASPVNLSEGETSQIQINLHPVSGIHVTVPPGFSCAISAEGPGGTWVSVAATYSSSPSGSSEISGIPAGHYVVQISNSSGSRTSALNTDLSDGMTCLDQTQTSVIRVSGKLVFEGGQPPPNSWQLQLIAQTGQIAATAQIASDGAIFFPNTTFAPGLYEIRLNSGSYFIRSVAPRGARIIGDRLELASGSNATLTIVAAAYGEGSKLDGIALRSGNPVPGVMVLLVPSDTNRTTLYRRDQTDSDGSFSMANIPPGRYTLVGIDDDGRDLTYKDPAVIQRYLQGGHTLYFPLRSDDPVKVTLQPRLH